MVPGVPRRVVCHVWIVLAWAIPVGLVPVDDEEDATLAPRPRRRFTVVVVVPRAAVVTEECVGNPSVPVVVTDTGHLALGWCF
jgi:hypothetical protein